MTLKSADSLRPRRNQAQLLLVHCDSANCSARAIACASKQDCESMTVSAAALPPAHRLARGVKALARRSHRRNPEVSPRVAWTTRPRSRIGAFSRQSDDDEVSP